MSEQDASVKVEDIWRGLEEVYDKGLTRAIGISNFNEEQTERIIKIARVPIHNIQVFGIFSKRPPGGNAPLPCPIQTCQNRQGTQHLLHVVRDARIAGARQLHS